MYVVAVVFSRLEWNKHILHLPHNCCMSDFTQLLSLAQPLFWKIAIGSSIVFYATDSFGLSATEVAKIAKEATVKIESDNSQGSGEIIQQQSGQYLVLTSAHVVRGNKVKYTVVTSDNRRYPLTAEAIQTIPGVDLAVLKFTSDRQYSVPKLGDANTSTEGTTAYVSGFPSGTEAIDVSIFSFTDGKITANSSKPLKDGYSIIYSNNTLPGMSGGGVFNDRGELIAIHGKGDVDTKIQISDINPNIRVKTGFNLGIPINTFQQLSTKIGLKIGTGTSIVRSDRSKVDDFILSGFERVSKSDLPGSVVEFTKAIERNPKLVTARFWRGSCKLLMGDTRGAVEDLTIAIALNPKKVESYMYRGSAYAKLGNATNAIADLDKAVSLSPQSDVVYGNRCALKSQLRDFTGALTDCNRAIQLNPKNGFYYSSRGSAYYQLNRFQEALSDQNTAIKLSPEDKIRYVNRGLAKASLGDNRGAISDYNIALKSKYDAVTSASIYRTRGQSKSNLKDRRGAIADFDRSLQIFASDPQTYFFRGNTYYELGNFSVAIKDFDRAIELNPQLAEAYLLRGVVQNDNNNPQEAIGDFDRVIQLNPNLTSVALANRGISKFNLKDRSSALADFDRAISLDLAVPKAYYYRGLIKAESGNKQGAIADLQAAAKLYLARKDDQKYQLTQKKIAELQKPK
jgi:tetratricopeptide (TPR) repeat protein/S1-C subfamily serine protease